MKIFYQKIFLLSFFFVLFFATYCSQSRMVRQVSSSSSDLELSSKEAIFLKVKKRTSRDLKRTRSFTLIFGLKNYLKAKGLDKQEAILGHLESLFNSYYLRFDDFSSRCGPDNQKYLSLEAKCLNLSELDKRSCFSHNKSWDGVCSDKQRRAPTGACEAFPIHAKLGSKEGACLFLLASYNEASQELEFSKIYKQDFKAVDLVLDSPVYFSFLGLEAL